MHTAYFFFCNKDREAQKKGKKPKYFNIKVILVLNIFVFSSHLFKSKILVYVFGYKIQ